MDLHQIDTGPIAEFVEPLHSGGHSSNLTQGRRDSHEFHGGIANGTEEPVDGCSRTFVETDEFLRIQHHTERSGVRKIETEQVGVGGVGECSEIALCAEGSKAKLNGVDAGRNETLNVPAHHVCREVPAVVIAAVP